MAGTVTFHPGVKRSVSQDTEENLLFIHDIVYCIIYRRIFYGMLQHPTREIYYNYSYNVILILIEK